MACRQAAIFLKTASDEYQFQYQEEDYSNGVKTVPEMPKEYRHLIEKEIAPR